MALHLGAQSSRFARLVSNIIRPTSIGFATIGVGFQSSPVQPPNVEEHIFNSIDKPTFLSVSKRPASGSLNSRKHLVAAATNQNVKFGMFAAGFGTGFGAGLGAEFASDTRSKARSAAAVFEKEGVKSPDSERGSFNTQAAKRPAVKERMVRTALLQAIKDWPPDVNLDSKLYRGEIGGKPLFDQTIKAVLYQLAQAPSNVPSWDRIPPQGGAVENAELMFALDEQKCTPDDALRALNLYTWRRNEYPDNARLLKPLLQPMLKALSKAELHEELRSVWEDHKGLAEQTDDLLPEFLAAFFHAGLFDDVIKTFAEASSRKCLMNSTTASIVVRTLREKGCSRDEVWAFYKEWVQETNLELDQRQAFCDLLESGVSIDNILSLKYTDKVRVRNRLIQALATLGRKDEAQKLVSGFLHNPLYRHPLRYYTLLSLLRTFVRSGFAEEAQQLADEQAKLGVRLDNVLAFALRNQRAFQSGYEAYKALQAIEGPHKRSLEVQSLLISNVYAKLGLTEAIYEAYVLGRRLEGDFDANIFSIVLHHIGKAEKDYTAEAEGVLSDYFEVRSRKKEMGSLTDYAFQCLGDMFLRASQPQKLAKMVKELVSHNLFVSDKLARYWIWALDLQNCFEEAEELRTAQDELSRRHYMAQLKNRAPPVQGSEASYINRAFRKADNGGQRY